MKLPAFLVGGFVLSPLLFLTQPVRPAAEGCALLSAADLTILLGGTPTGKPTGIGCTWSIPGSPRKLLAIPLKISGPSAERMFAGARMAAAKGANRTVTDETGLGDKAFSSLESFGVAMIVLKQGHVLQLQYWTGGAGTAKDVVALRPVAKKAVAAF